MDYIIYIIFWFKILFFIMELKIFNTLWREKQVFKPIDKNEVGIYSCGPTVYWKPHIWNMRSYIFANLLRNVIENILWYKVKHVVNITDVGHLTDDWDNGEDKLEKTSKKEWKTAFDIAKEYENVFYNYLNMLNLNFDIFPKATEHIKEQIDMIKILEEKWYTYKIENDGIYMDTSKVEDYGKLLPKGHIEWLQACARVENNQKKNKTDFALWKFSPVNEKRQMEWNSPWGVWFPWWHIECSAMSVKYLWKHFDIHTWGIDHIPVHHTNEIAQTESCYGTKWVNYWLHNEFLNLKNDKMSKSKWNVITLDTIKEKWIDPLKFKYFIYLAHYRNIQNFSFKDLEAVWRNYDKIVEKLKNYNLDNIEEPTKKDLENSEFIAYLLDDLDTVKLLALINKKLSWNLTNKDLSLLKFIDEKILKLDLFKKASIKQNIPEDIQNLAEKRLQAKREKNFELADKLRDEIQSKWYNILDTKDGYYIKK